MEYEGSEECGKDEENKPEPILEAKYPRDCTSEAGGDELDVVYRVVIEQDMRGKEPLLLFVRRGRHRGGRSQLASVYLFAFTRSPWSPQCTQSQRGIRSRSVYSGQPVLSDNALLPYLKTIRILWCTLLARQRGRQGRHTLSLQIGNRQLPYPPVCAKSK